MTISASGSVMANRYNCYDLDPTYRNAFGQPLMRMTFDYKENEHRMGQHAAKLINDIARSMNPTHLNPATARTDPWTVVPYQSTHNTGGSIMGTNPRESAREPISAEPKRAQTRRTIAGVSALSDGAPSCCIAARVSARRISSTRSTPGWPKRPVPTDRAGRCTPPARRSPAP